MTFDPTVHHRRSIRLQGYDYSRVGAYFVTLCTRNRACLFGEIVDGEVRLNDAGQVAQTCWNEIPAHFPHVELDEFVVMPNHVHGIFYVVDFPPVGAMVGAKNFSPLRPSSQQPHGPSKTVGSVVRGFKIGVTKWVRQNTYGRDVWQRNYWEHIVRDEPELTCIREYIRNNPAQWKLDELNPTGSGPSRGEKIFAPTNSTEGTRRAWTRHSY